MDKILEELKALVKEHPEVVVFIATVVNDAISEAQIPAPKASGDPLSDVFAGAKDLKRSQEAGEQAKEIAARFGQLVVELVTGALTKIK